MKRFFLFGIFLLGLIGFNQAQSWRAVVEAFGDREISFCSAVQNGIAQIPVDSAGAGDYRTRLILDDTVYVGNDFAIEVRMVNAEANGGITAFDPGVYVEGCDFGAGATFMGDAWAQAFNSIYVGSAWAGDLPELVQDFSDWRVMRYVFANNRFDAFLDGQLVYSLPYNGRIDFLYQLTVRFKGSGLVDWIRLYDANDQEIWREEFDDCNNMTPFPEVSALTAFATSNDTTVCRGEPLRLAATTAASATYQWTGPNGFSSGSGNPLLSAINPADTGFYYVTATFSDCIELRDSVHVGLREIIIPEPGFLGADTTLCPGDTLRLGNAYPCALYQWQNGLSAPFFTVNRSGTYLVRIDLDGQTYRDTIRVDYFPMPQIALGNDTTLCPGETILLDAALATADTYQWQDGSAAATFTVQSEGLYVASVTDVCGNTTSDSVRVDYFEVLQPLNLGSDTTLCPGETLLLDATDPAAVAYQWQDGSQLPTFTADESGIYTVVLTDNCNNTLTDSIEIQYFDIIETVNLGRDTTLCPGDVLTLNVANPAAVAYQWQDGSTAASFTIQQPGTYSVTLTDNCGNSASDAITVAYFDILESLDLGADQTVCPNEIITLNAFDDAAISYRWQDDSSQPEITVLRPGIYTVTLQDNCGTTLSDSVEVSYFQILTSFSLGSDTTLCAGEVLEFDFTNAPAIAFQEWQDGSAASVYQISTPGRYAVTVRDRCGNSEQDQITVRYDEIPVADLGADTTLCEGTIHRLDATAENADFYQWSNGSVEAVLPVWEPGFYSVTIGNRCGTNTYSTMVDFEYCGPCRTGVPNAFSPNGDGTNDALEVFSECILTDYEFRVFDRWGTQVFMSRNPSFFWDGTFNGQLMASGVYFWSLSYEADDGSNANLSGDVTLVR